MIPPASSGASVASEFSDRIIIRGVHFKLTPELHVAALAKGMRLLRHHGRLIRIRIDLQHHHRAKDDNGRFGATGRIEISGPDLVAHVASEQPAEALDLLVDKLDRMLRERTKTRTNRRNDRPPGTEFRDRIALPADLGAAT
jgi:putative sigma-54 modulation protein